MFNVVSTRLNVTFDNKSGDTLFLGKNANGKKRATVTLAKRLRKEIEVAFESNETLKIHAHWHSTTTQRMVCSLKAERQCK